MSTRTTAARAAAEWWAERVGAPVHRLVRDGERDFSSDFAEMGMAMVAARHPVPDGAGAAFADALEKLVAARFERTDRVVLATDYGPDPELGDLGRAHGIHASRFPMKTCMWAYPDHVTAALGYGSPTRLVWAAPDWERPTCHSLAYDAKTQKFGTDWCTLPLFHDGDHGDWKPDPRRCERCGRTEAEHYNDERPTDWHSFKAVES